MQSILKCIIVFVYTLTNRNKIVTLLYSLDWKGAQKCATKNKNNEDYSNNIYNEYTSFRVCGYIGNCKKREY